MLSIAAQTKLLKSLKFSDENIAELMKVGEYDVDVPILHILSDEELNTLKTNIKSGHENAYPEIWGKKMNEKHKLGLSTTDAKDEEKVITAMQAKAVKDAGISKDSQVSALESDMQKLRDVIAEKEGALTQFQTKLKERDEFDTYVSMLPSERLKNLDNDIHVSMAKKHVVIGEKGVAINPQTGEPYKDTLMNPRLAKDVIPEIYKQNNWLEAESAAGAGKRTLGTPSNMVQGKNTAAQNDLVAKAQAMFPDDARQQASYITTQRLAEANS